MARIAFFGTPDFAANQFDTLIGYCREHGHTILFAVCQPDRPIGRSQKLVPPPVKAIALNHQIPILQPQTLKAGSQDGEEFYQILKDAALDLAIVVAYGRLIPTRMLALPKRGFVNVHASLLPRWRGASPIQRAIMAGDAKTGVSIMELVPEMDAGDVYEMKSLEIGKDDTAGSLTERLAQLGSATLLSCIEQILDGTKAKTPQPNTGITFAPKLEKSDGLIPWEKSNIEIFNHARGVNPWPQAFTYLKGKMVKLFGAIVVDESVLSPTSLSATPGTIVKASETLTVACGRGAVCFDSLQFEGRRQTSISDALNGNLIQVGDILSRENR